MGWFTKKKRKKPSLTNDHLMVMQRAFDSAKSDNIFSGWSGTSNTADEELKNQFDTLKVLVSSLKDSYGDFLWRTVQEDEELGLSFVPVSLRKHVPVILKSRKGELVDLNR